MNINNLQSLDLRNCEIPETGFIELVNSLKTNYTLTELNLSSNSLSSPTIYNLAESLELNKTLQILSLANISHDISPIVKALSFNIGLTELNLRSYNYNVSDIIKYLTESLAK